MKTHGLFHGTAIATGFVFGSETMRAIIADLITNNFQLDLKGYLTKEESMLCVRMLKSDLV